MAYSQSHTAKLTLLVVAPEAPAGTPFACAWPRSAGGCAAGMLLGRLWISFGPSDAVSASLSSMRADSGLIPSPWPLQPYDAAWTWCSGMITDSHRFRWTAPSREASLDRFRMLFRLKPCFKTLRVLTLSLTAGGPAGFPSALDDPVFASCAQQRFSAVHDPRAPQTVSLVTASASLKSQTG